MTRVRLLLPALFVLFLLTLTSFGAEAPRGPSAGAYERLPLAFEPNQGQAPAGARFLARGGGYTIVLRDGGAELLLGTSKERAAAIRLELLGARPASAATAEPLETRVNYLKGKDARRWVTGVPTFGRVRFAEVYRATDLVYYGNQGRLEYDFVVRPGGDAGAIGIAVAGAKPRVRRDGSLALAAEGREVVWQKPVAYQERGGKRVAVAARYRLAGNRVRFELGRYDRRRALVIDPVLAYSTFFGGTGTEEARGIAVDAAGAAYVTGMTRSADMPTSGGAFDRSCGSDGTCDNFDGPLADAFVMKLKADGSGVFWATYLGGNDFDIGNGIAVDSSGHAYVAGETFSSDFPGTLLGAGNPAAGLAFAVKLHADGSGLDYGVLFGGANSSNGTAATGVKVDAAFQAYLTGVTDASDFPVTAGAFQTTYGGAPSGTGGDAFVAELNAAGTAFVYATYLGGNMRDTAEDLAIDGSGNVYVTGWTSSADFPTSAGAYRTTMPSAPSGFDPTTTFVTKVNAGGASLGYSTYLGGTNFWDIGYGIAVANGNAYVTGIAQSSDFPTTTGAIQRTLRGIADAFVTKLNTTGTGLVYSTLLGGTDGERGTGIAVNASGIAYVTGVTSSNDFPVNLYAFQQVMRDTFTRQDVFVTQLNATGTAFAFSSYLGGSGIDNDQNKARVALLGSNIFVSGSTTSPDFPTTVGAAMGSFAGGVDAFVTRIKPVCALKTTTPSLTICAPANNATTHQPTEIIAGTRDSRPVKLIQVYVDGKKAYEARLATLDVKLWLATGAHRVTVQAIDTTNVVFKSTVNINVTP